MSGPHFRTVRSPHDPLENRLALVAFASGIPAMLVALVLLWADDHSAKLRWTFTLLILLSSVGGALLLRARAKRPLQTIANLLAALREEDFSIRARGARHGDALGEVFFEINSLGDTLQRQRTGALEALSLLRLVMAEIDAAVFIFDQNARLRLANRAGEKLLGQPLAKLAGRMAVDIGLLDALQAAEDVPLSLSLPGGTGRWSVRRSWFRENGLPRTLVILTDLSWALREEERNAWRRLVRVLGHELNNSLAPIKSLAGSLETLIQRQPRLPDWEADLQRGLQIIRTRSESLQRFMQAYAQLARLPAPTLRSVNIADLIRRVAGLETRFGVQVESGPAVELQADGDQLEQLLINLIRNAVDASLETGGKVAIRWISTGSNIEIEVLDEGPGLMSDANLFVPFFTTKPNGTGIGLALSRQIAESHGGTLTLENRLDRTGCVARLRL
ncbi:MAG TPA: ATP-binding protein [Chthoniobacterales bacterium]